MSESPPSSGQAASRHRLALAEVVAELRAASVAQEPGTERDLTRHALPSREALLAVATALRAAMFPAHFGPGDASPEGLDFFVGRTVDTALSSLLRQVRLGLHLRCEVRSEDCAACDKRAEIVIRDFAYRLPKVRALLGADVQAAYSADPAATSLDEAIFCYPGITAITHHRLAHELHSLGVPMIPRILSEIAHSSTGIDIHPAALIDKLLHRPRNGRGDR
jgi:serine O-acetyltransferase